VALVVLGVGVEAAGRGSGEAGLDLGAQAGLVALRSPSRSASRASSTGMAASSPALSGTASWPSTRWAVVAKAETRWIGATPAARSWLRREVLPSMATKSGRSGQVLRTQAVNAAENRAGLIRFIRMVSQRPPGTPCR
jgi:hypothetical protein